MVYKKTNIKREKCLGGEKIFSSSKIMNYKKLISEASRLRKNTFLSFIKTGEAHLGGSFSIIEILIYLYKFHLKKKR